MERNGTLPVGFAAPGSSNGTLPLGFAAPGSSNGTLPTDFPTPAERNGTLPLAFTSYKRAIFRRALDVDDAAWLRAGGWALWKALITLAGFNQHDGQAARRVVDAVLVDFNGES